MYTRDCVSIGNYFLVSSCDFGVAILFCVFPFVSFEPHKDHNLSSLWIFA